MSRHKKKKIEIVGMSFLDLSACAFAGLLIMYLIAPKNKQILETVDEKVEFIKFEVENSLPYIVGVRLKLADGSFVTCWPEINCSNGKFASWNVSLGATSAVIKGASLDGTGSIILSDYQGSLGLAHELCVKVKTLKNETLVKLEYRKLYRSNFDLTTSIGRCL